MMYDRFVCLHVFHHLNRRIAYTALQMIFLKLLTYKKYHYSFAGLNCAKIIQDVIVLIQNSVLLFNTLTVPYKNNVYKQKKHKNKKENKYT